MGIKCLILAEVPRPRPLCFEKLAQWVTSRVFSYLIAVGLTFSYSFPVSAEDEDPDEEPNSGAVQQNDPSQQSLPPLGPTTHFGPRPRKSGRYDRNLIIPPFSLQSNAEVATTTLFPFYSQRVAGNDHQLLIGPYYQRRGKRDVDVAFPLLWSLRGPEDQWLIIPPFHAEWGKSSSLGLTPLFYWHRSAKSYYFLTPPLLTGGFSNPDESFHLAALYWRYRSKKEVNSGLMPFLWMQHTPDYRHVILPPLFFHIGDDIEPWNLTLVPPIFRLREENSITWGLAPILFTSRGPNYHWHTIFPLAHLAFGPQEFKLVTPLGGYQQDKDSSTLVALSYIRHRGDTHLDAVAPLFAYWTDPRIGSFNLITPIVSHLQTPADHTTVVAPLFAHWGSKDTSVGWATPLVVHKENYEEESNFTWVFPSLHLEQDTEANIFNFYPLLFSTEKQDNRHLVIAPLYWDFQSHLKNTRVTIAFPLHWRFESQGDIDQVTLNTYYQQRRKQGNHAWQFHLIPLMAFGQDGPGRGWWNLLYGLVGQNNSPRNGTSTRLFWLFEF